MHGASCRNDQPLRPLGATGSAHAVLDTGVSRRWLKVWFPIAWPRPSCATPFLVHTGIAGHEERRLQRLQLVESIQQRSCVTGWAVVERQVQDLVLERGPTAARLTRVPAAPAIELTGNPAPFHRRWRPTPLRWPHRRSPPAQHPWFQGRMTVRSSADRRGSEPAPRSVASCRSPALTSLRVWLSNLSEPNCARLCLRRLCPTWPGSHTTCRR